MLAKTEDTAREVITEKKLRSLMKSKRSAQAEITEIAGGLGSEIKQAVDNNHLNKKIFTFICSLDKMENEKIAMYLDDLDHYLDISGLRDRASKATATMNLAQDETEEEDQEATGGKKPRGGKKGAKADNVTQLNKPFPAPAGESKD